LVGTDPDVRKEWEEAWKMKEMEEEQRIAYTQEIIIKEREKRLS
jgi:hypothetical protein